MLRKRVVSALLCAAAALACLAPMPTTMAGQPDPATDTPTSTSTPASSKPKKTRNASDTGKQSTPAPSSPSTAKTPSTSDTGKQTAVGKTGTGQSELPGKQSQTPTQQPTVGPQDNTCTPLTRTWNGSDHGGSSGDTINWNITTDCKMTITSGTLSQNYNATDLPWQQTTYKTQITELTAQNLTLGVYFNSMASWFSGMTSLATITIPDLDITHLDGSTGMNGIFAGCTDLTTMKMEGWQTNQDTYKLIPTAIRTSPIKTEPIVTTVDLARLNTGNATSISKMFATDNLIEGPSATDWDLTGWTLPNVSSSDGSTSATALFSGNSNVKRITATDWHYRCDGISLNNMFYNCTNLETVNLSHLVTSHNNSLHSFFAGCPNLASLDLSGWDTSNVYNMEYMFQGCAKLESLNLSDWDTSNVITMPSMFNGDTKLSDLDMSNWNISKLNRNSTNNMFTGCSSLKTLKMKNWTISDSIVTNHTLAKAIASAPAATKADLEKLDVGTATSLLDMFANTSTGSTITDWDLTGWNLRNVTDASNLFEGNQTVTHVTATDWSYGSSVETSIRGMFNDCVNLESADLTNLATNNVTDMSYMFQNCSSLTSLDLSSFNIGSSTSIDYILYGCNGITQLRLGPDEDKLTPQVQSGVFTTGRAAIVMVEGRQTGDGNQYSFYSDKTPENVYQVSAATWFKVADRGIRYGRPTDTGFFPPACVNWDNKPTGTCTVAGSDGMTVPANQKLKDWKSIDGSTTYIPGGTVSMPTTARFITVEPEWEVQVTPVSSLPFTGGRHWMLAGMLLLGASLLALTATATLRDHQRNSHSL
ncbi:BspA family leucine-rich repeat surface protein [Bifidobacterium sp. ESL0745]|uniref:BspA family leucine-rich repeat surface protein n=1 Tax=Bifidobacterium sp. ESL0745 TaxID=2983226 RepID=UPI0023F80615|nr:BspA family leucine-rich repeat surface protein [Bifidobacterium sp. ESL0745]MDF7665754.1 BspA family leucine-rich repeat surface protein [Bifidobacterium sp. ESL0745]